MCRYHFVHLYSVQCSLRCALSPDAASRNASGEDQTRPGPARRFANDTLLEFSPLGQRIQAVRPSSPRLDFRALDWTGLVPKRAHMTGTDWETASEMESYGLYGRAREIGRPGSRPLHLSHTHTSSIRIHLTRTFPADRH